MRSSFIPQHRETLGGRTIVINMVFALRNVPAQRVAITGWTANYLLVSSHWKHALGSRQRTLKSAVDA